MSNLSDIGFSTGTEDELERLLNKLAALSEQIECTQGSYLKYSDASGAEIYLQMDKAGNVLGFNPHFSGISKRKVVLISEVLSPYSELDGAFYCRVSPSEENDPDSDACPFAFDTPDFRTLGKLTFPKTLEIQLAAFAGEDLKIYESEDDFFASQTTEIKFASRSFIPSGLFTVEDAQSSEEEPFEAAGIFAGTILEWEKRQNTFTGENFYWFLVDTVGGTADVVADVKLIDRQPAINGVLQGFFWLSGNLIYPRISGEFSQKQSFWKK